MEPTAVQNLIDLNVSMSPTADPGWNSLAMDRKSLQAGSAVQTSMQVDRLQTQPKSVASVKNLAQRSQSSIQQGQVVRELSMNAIAAGVGIAVAGYGLIVGGALLGLEVPAIFRMAANAGTSLALLSVALNYLYGGIELERLGELAFQNAGPLQQAYYLAACRAEEEGRLEEMRECLAHYHEVTKLTGAGELLEQQPNRRAA